MISVSMILKTKVISFLEPPFWTVMQFCRKPDLIKIVIDIEIVHILLTNKFTDKSFERLAILLLQHTVTKTSHDSVSMKGLDIQCALDLQFYSKHHLQIISCSKQ